MKRNRRKQHGGHHTPSELARFVAGRTLAQGDGRQLVALDPACGDGELLLALALEADAAATSRLRISSAWTTITTPSQSRRSGCPWCLRPATACSQAISWQWGFYHAFVAAMTAKLDEDGVLGLLCSNRFTSTKGGLSLRALLIRNYDIAELWDLGDTKLFEAAVLPAVVVARRARRPTGHRGSFVRVYEADAPDEVTTTASLLEALEGDAEGAVAVAGRSFAIERGELVNPEPERPWRVASSNGSRWLATVTQHASGRFADVGPVRVGIKGGDGSSRSTSKNCRSRARAPLRFATCAPSSMSFARLMPPSRMGG